MPPREPSSLEVTFPHEFIARRCFLYSLERGSAVGRLCPFSSLPCGIGGWVESGAVGTEKVAGPTPSSEVRKDPPHPLNEVVFPHPWVQSLL